jgi:hypothetical protein
MSRVGKVALLDVPLIKYRYSPGQLSAPKHTADLAKTRLLVLEDLARRDPALAASPELRRRLAFSYAAVAEATAEEEPGPALGHLARAVRGGQLDRTIARAFAKAVLPRSVLARLRRHRRRG